MPKGVEHKKSAQTLPMVLGVESLMPKGVEHANIGLCGAHGTGVESLMPKGVEHLGKAGTLVTGSLVSNL